MHNLHILIPLCLDLHNEMRADLQKPNIIAQAKSSNGQRNLCDQLLGLIHTAHYIEVPSIFHKYKSMLFGLLLSGHLSIAYNGQPRVYLNCYTHTHMECLLS